MARLGLNLVLRMSRRRSGMQFLKTTNLAVMIPTLRRPEMLALALEKLQNTPQSPSLDVRIFLDTQDEDRLRETEFVRDEYFPDATLYCSNPHVEVPSGMWNILNALKQGFQTGAEYVFMVEEDVLVYPDFFDWHLEAQRSGDWFATCGRRLRLFPKYDNYTNSGSCFHRDKLALVIPHINDEMFADRRIYYDRMFGKMDEVSDLDDGLIRRIAKHGGYQVLYPDKPKCAHIGFRGYNHYMDWVNVGSIERRIEQLRKMLSTIDPNGRFTRDFEPFLA